MLSNGSWSTKFWIERTTHGMALSSPFVLATSGRTWASMTSPKSPLEAVFLASFFRSFMTSP
jgi:hypothetical protein